MSTTCDADRAFAKVTMRRTFEAPVSSNLFEVWIDLLFGASPREWARNSRPKPLSDALDEAAEARKADWVVCVLPEGQSPQ